MKLCDFSLQPMKDIWGRQKRNTVVVGNKTRLLGGGKWVI